VISPDLHLVAVSYGQRGPQQAVQQCRRCREAKPVDEFRFRGDIDRSGRRVTACRSCERAVDRQRRRSKDYVVVAAPAPQWPIAGFDLQREDWMKSAACRGMGPDLFFPGRGKSPQEVQAICASCPVRDRCDDYAERTRPDGGIWGGVTELGRKKRRKERRAS
jgi:WhiB family redox-sensing transcriptional regulator